MSTPVRQRESELTAVLKANRLEPPFRALTQLLQSRLETLDSKLRRCEAHEFAQLQGRAQVYEQLLAEINGT